MWRACRLRSRGRQEESFLDRRVFSLVWLASRPVESAIARSAVLRRRSTIMHFSCVKFNSSPSSTGLSCPPAVPGSTYTYKNVSKQTATRATTALTTLSLTVQHSLLQHTSTPSLRTLKYYRYCDITPCHARCAILLLTSRACAPPQERCMHAARTDASLSF